EAYLRLKNTRDLRPRQLAALRELHGWREDVARERDVAPFRVLSNETLVELARRMPEQVGDLPAINGLSAGLAQRRGTEIVAALRRARALPDTALPERPRAPRRPPPDPEFDELVERLKAARDAAADTLGLDRGFLMPRQQLEELARRRPRSVPEMEAVPDVRRWQAEALGRVVLKAIRAK
ncbi:MAG: HRDC domain-containing protein, partial [Longimicrobiales bacterium]